MIIPFCIQLLYGLSGPLNKVAITQVPFSLYVGIKLLMAGVVLLIYHIFVKKQSLRLPSAQWGYYVQMIVCGAIGAQYLKYWGLQYVSASKAAFLFNSSPFFVAFFAWLRWGESLMPMQWLGLCISFIGLIPIVWTTSPAEELMGMIGITSLPEAAIICAATLHAISFTAKRQVLHIDGYTPTRINGIYFCIGGLWSLMSWLASGVPYQEGIFTIALTYAAGTMLLGKVFCSSVSLYLLRHYSPTFLSCMEYWYPFCVAFWSWLLWGEHLSYHYWISAVIILCGQCIFYRTIRLNKATSLQ